MSTLAQQQLAAYLADCKLTARLVLLTGLNADIPFDAAPRVLVIATADTLALLPQSGGNGDGASDLAAARIFSGDFNTFSRFQRRWGWTAVLQAQLDALLTQLELALAQDTATGLYLYLNGAFNRKYFPSTQAGPHLAATAPADHETCRATNSRLEDILAAFGNASLQATSMHPTPGHDSYHCYSAQNRMLGIGRGTTDRQMMCGAVFEYCERWVGLTRPGNCVHGSYTELGAQALGPEHMLGLTREQCQRMVPGFDAQQQMAWLPARREDSGQAALVPLAMVNYLLDPGVPFSRYQNSNGCALGNSFEEAALFGALEVIERDALLATWYSQSPPPRIDLGTVSCDRTAGLLLLLEAAGYDVLCFDMTLDLPVATILVLMLGRTHDKLAGFVTAASHPHPAVALRSALAEAQSLIGSAERNFARHQQRLARDPAELQRLRNENQALYYGHAEQRHHFDFLAQTEPTLDYAGYLARHPSTPSTPQAAYRQLCRQAADAGYGLIAVDNTPAMLRTLNLSSARVFIPATIPLAFGEHVPAIPALRMANAARSAAWIRSSADLAAPPLHPLG